MFEQQARARHEQTDDEESKEQEEVKHRWHSWALRMYERNAQRGREARSLEPWIENAALLSFDGNQESWPGFRRVVSGVNENKQKREGA